MQASKPAEPFDTDAFIALCQARGWDQPVRRAEALGFHVGTLTRIESGKRQPGLAFALACRRTFGLEAFARLFPITEEAHDARR